MFFAFAKLFDSFRLKCMENSCSKVAKNLPFEARQLLSVASQVAMLFENHRLRGSKMELLIKKLLYIIFQFQFQFIFINAVPNFIFGFLDQMMRNSGYLDLTL